MGLADKCETPGPLATWLTRMVSPDAMGQLITFEGVMTVLEQIDAEMRALEKRIHSKEGAE